MKEKDNSGKDGMEEITIPLKKYKFSEEMEYYICLVGREKKSKEEKKKKRKEKQKI